LWLAWRAIRDGAVIRIARLATYYGVVLGAVGGAIGMFVGDFVKYFLTNALIELQIVGENDAVNVVVEMLTRGVGWTILGVAIGMSEGLAARSLGKLSYGTHSGGLWVASSAGACSDFVM